MRTRGGQRGTLRLPVDDGTRARKTSVKFAVCVTAPLQMHGPGGMSCFW